MTTRMISKSLAGCIALAALVCSGSLCSAALIGHWSFDETDGMTAGEAIGGHDATLLGNATFAPDEGQFGGALLLDNPGSPDTRRAHAEFDWDSVFDTTTYTVSIWFKTARAVDGHFGLTGNRPPWRGPSRP